LIIHLFKLTALCLFIKLIEATTILTQGGRIKYISDNLTCFDTITLYLNTYEVHIKSFVSPKKLEQKENIQITLLKDNFKIIYKGYFNLQGIKNLHPVQVIP
jgi:hypothetical protein